VAALELPHPGHLAPGDLRVARLEGLRNLLGRLAEDLEPAHDSELRLLVGDKLFLGHSTNKLAHLFGGLEHVMQVVGEVAWLRHTGIRSCWIR
jgi:hypothetical protein